MHIPTGIEMKEDVPEGHYTKKEMQKLRDKAIENLIIQIVEKVKNTKPS